MEGNSSSPASADKAKNLANKAGLSPLIELLKEECHLLIEHLPRPDDGQVYCNATFDGWGCWPHTLAGTTAHIACSDSIFRDHTSGYANATKKCESDGTWYVSPLTNRSYSNYTLCSQITDKGIDHGIPMYIFIAGNAVSIILLTISLCIFYAFRQLRCERITVHKNLFVSYVLTGITWTLYYVLAAYNGLVLLENPVWCQVLHVLAEYCTACNFAWMFCEGLYLHIIMAHAFRTGKILIRVLLFVGWGHPLILTIIYTCVRALKKAHTEAPSFYLVFPTSVGWPHPPYGRQETPKKTALRCWTQTDSLQYIIGGPIMACIVVNVLILINLVRLLVTKLRQIPDAPQSRKAVRATLILAPLFGIQYLALSFKPEEGTMLEMYYHNFIALFISLQGALVSIMYCFCNGEVISLLRRKWHQHRLMTGHVRKNTALTSSTCTEGYSMVNTSTRDLSSQKSKVAPDLHNFALQDSVEMKPLKTEKQET